MFNSLKDKTKKYLVLYLSYFFMMFGVALFGYYFFVTQEKSNLYDKMNEHIIILINDLVKPECLVK